MNGKYMNRSQLVLFFYLGILPIVLGQDVENLAKKTPVKVTTRKQQNATS